MRTDTQLIKLGFNMVDIKEFRRQEKLYMELSNELIRAEEAKDYDKVVELEPKVEKLEFLLKYQGVNPKEIPVKDLRAMLTGPAAEDRLITEYKSKIRNPGTGIRSFCVYCMGGATAEVRRCQAVQCVLFPFRMGKNPFFGKTIPKVEESVLENDDLDVVIEEDETDEGVENAD